MHVVYLEGKIRFWPVDVHVSNLFLSLHCAERFEKSRISKWLEENFFNEVQRFLQNLYLGGKNKILRPQKDLRALTLNQAVRMVKIIGKCNKVSHKANDDEQDQNKAQNDGGRPW